MKSKLMKRYIAIAMILLGVTAMSCNRSSCPAYEDNTNKMKLDNGSKTKSGALPKGKN